MGDDFDDIEDMLIPFETLEVLGKRIKLQGLTLPNIISIVRNHFDALEPLYQLSIGGKLDADMTTIAAEMGENFGPVAVSVVAAGMRTKALDKVDALPVPAQIEALEKILVLTMTDMGGLEKTMEIVNRALAAVVNRMHPKP